MQLVDIIGFIAATLTTFAFIPQAIKTVKTKSTDDLSISMYTCFVLGVSAWLVYGIFINDLPIIVANSVTLVFAFAIFITILQNKLKKR